MKAIHSQKLESNSQPSLLRRFVAPCCVLQIFIFFQLHAVSRTQQGRQREPSVNTLRSPFCYLILLFLILHFTNLIEPVTTVITTDTTFLYFIIKHTYIHSRVRTITKLKQFISVCISAKNLCSDQHIHDMRYIIMRYNEGLYVFVVFLLFGKIAYFDVVM